MTATGWAVLLGALIAVVVALGVVLIRLESPSRVERFASVRRLSGAILAVAIVAIVGAVAVQGAPGGSAPAASGPRPAPSKSASLATVLRDVRASDKIRIVPADLAAQASADVATPWTNLGEPAVSTGCQPSAEQDDEPPCVFGDQSGSHTMVLYGDSHAGMWFDALNDIAKRIHWKLISLFKPACPALLLPVRLYKTPGTWTACDQWHRFAINRINRIDPNLLIISQATDYEALDGHPYTSSQWRRGMKQLLTRVRARSTSVLGDLPDPETDPYYGPPCVERHLLDVETCSVGPLSMTRYKAAEREGAAATGAHYVDVTPWFCAARCSAVIGNYIVYLETNHVSVGYSRFLEGVLAEALDLPAVT